MKCSSPRRSGFALAAAMFTHALLAPAAAPAGGLPPPQIFVVTDSTDTDDGTCDSDCTLREAIHAANADTIEDTIRFASSMTITLASSLPLIEYALIIEGQGQTVTIDGNSSHRIFATGNELTLTGLRLNNAQSATSGGAISMSGNILTVRDCSFEGNGSSAKGGAIYGTNSLVAVDNSAFFGNDSATGGSAVHVHAGEGDVNNSTFGYNTGGNAAFVAENCFYAGIMHCTFYLNQAALYVDSSNVGLGNSILAGSSDPDCTIASGTFNPLSTKNLIEDGTCGPTWSGSPGLNPIASYNGGPTGTFALNPGSIAIDAGDGTLCDAAGPTDQRGVLRPIGAACDLGAYESGTAVCGNGFLEGGETCDDGNNTNGDCCSATCTAEPDGQACADEGFACTQNECSAGFCVGVPDDDLCDDGTLCTVDTCSPSSGCVYSQTPPTGCSNEAPTKASVSISNSLDPAKRSVQFKWSGSFDYPDLGTPTSTTDYALCIYDDGTLVAHLDALPGGSMCGDKPCWDTTGSDPTGVKYKDPAKPAVGDGISAITAKSSEEGKAKLQVKAKGSSIPAFSLGTGMGIGLPVRVQVRTSDASCWEARFTSDHVSKNETEAFKAKF